MANLVTLTLTNSARLTCPQGITQFNLKAQTNSRAFPQPNSRPTYNIPNYVLMDAHGNLLATGNNNSGGLGNGNATSYLFYVSVASPLKFRDVCLGVGTAAIAMNNQVYTWGYNTYGGLGVGDVNPRSTPTLILGAIKALSITNISTPGTYDGFIVLGEDRNLYSWGGVFTSGALGLGSTTSTSTPTLISGIYPYNFITGGNNIAFGITNNSNVTYAWGNNAYGQLGVGDANPRSTPTLVLGGYSFTNIVTNGYSSYGLDASGNAYAWGQNTYGQLGIGSVVSKSSPVLVLGTHSFSNIYVNGGAVFGITTAGDLYAWGNNAYGQLGVGDVNNRTSPTLVLGGHTWTKLGGSTQATPDATTCMVGLVTTSSGTSVYAWGYARSGIVGPTTYPYTTNYSSPIAVVGFAPLADSMGGLDINLVGAEDNSGSSANSACFIINDQGNIFNWGNNSQFLGNGFTGQTQNEIVEKTISVIPGNSYDFNFGNFGYSGFTVHDLTLQKYTVISNLPTSQVTITYDQ